MTSQVPLTYNPTIELQGTQRSNAKIQRHFRFSPPRTSQEFEEKTCKTSVGKCYKNSTVRENYKLGGL